MFVCFSQMCVCISVFEVCHGNTSLSQTLLVPHLFAHRTLFVFPDSSASSPREGAVLASGRPPHVATHYNLLVICLPVMGSWK